MIHRLTGLDGGRKTGWPLQFGWFTEIIRLRKQTGELGCECACSVLASGQLGNVFGMLKLDSQVTRLPSCCKYLILYITIGITKTAFCLETVNKSMEKKSSCNQSFRSLRCWSCYRSVIDPSLRFDIWRPLHDDMWFILLILFLCHMPSVMLHSKDEKPMQKTSRKDHYSGWNPEMKESWSKMEMK